MDAMKALRLAMERSGRTQKDICASLGKTRGYISATLSRGSYPRVDTFVHIAAAAGYRLVMRSADDEILVD